MIDNKTVCSNFAGRSIPAFLEGSSRQTNDLNTLTLPLLNICNNARLCLLAAPYSLLDESSNLLHWMNHKTKLGYRQKEKKTGGKLKNIFVQLKKKNPNHYPVYILVNSHKVRHCQIFSAVFFFPYKQAL